MHLSRENINAYDVSSHRKRQYTRKKNLLTGPRNEKAGSASPLLECLCDDKNVTSLGKYINRILIAISVLVPRVYNNGCEGARIKTACGKLHF